MWAARMPLTFQDTMRVLMFFRVAEKADRGKFIVRSGPLGKTHRQALSERMNFITSRAFRAEERGRCSASRRQRTASAIMPEK